jgi:phosphatidylinositol alpha-1,6-mannosyltransferase
VTNDFPPKIGGIQNYLWELWRRLPQDVASVYTTPYSATAAFDARQPLAIQRSAEPWLIPYPWLAGRVRRLADAARAELILLDPAIPLGAIGPRLGRPYGVVLHGAEVTIPGRLPVLGHNLANTLRRATLVVSAGRYALDEAERCAGRSLPSVVIPPGVDSERFTPPSAEARAKARARYGLGPDDVLLATVSRLVPRKGMATLVRAAAEVGARRGNGDRSSFRVIIGGTGRQAAELASLAADLAAPVEFTGRLSDDEVVELYQAADLMAMLCNERWFGLEQEGFGIVFLEAAAMGLPQVAGRSGGAHEAVEHDVTGLIVDDPTSVKAAADAIERLVDDPDLRRRLGAEARRRAVDRFDYQRLAGHLQAAVDASLPA